MADCCNPTVLFVLIRAAHYAACLLLLAIWAFEVLVLPSIASIASAEIKKRWEMLAMFWTALLLPLIAISGVAWFVVVCANMSGLPLKDAIKPDVLRTVLNETHFGRVWQVRCLLWIGAVAMPGCISLRMPRFLRGLAVWMTVIFAGSMAASLAWAGHGQDGRKWHLIADAVHLLTAGLWPMGLAPFGLLLLQLRSVPALHRGVCISALTRRFSMISLCGVAMLTMTGIINGLFMIGSVGALVRTSYGKVLLLKLLLFALMVMIGAVNLIWLKPRLERSEVSAKRLQWNVWGELGLGLVVLIVTAVLGLLAPG